jgi:uncharacterized protein (DUF305 family)
MSKKMMSVLLPALAAGTVLAGCGGGGDHSHQNMPAMSSSASMAPGAGQQSVHNQADVAFAQQMIPHHQQAVEMAKMVPSHSSNQQVIDLANQVQQAQAPEIQQMTSWLRAWGASVPTTGMGATSMPGMDHGSMPSMTHGSMPGMMPAQDMAKLNQAHGTEFDRMWLQMMIQHHQGAIDMSKTELAQGSNPDAKQLAQRIIGSQQKEIDTMKGLLSRI